MMAEQERQGPKHRQDAVLPGVERKNPKKGEHRCRSQHAPQICRAHAWLGVICLVPQLGARPRSVHAGNLVPPHRRPRGLGSMNVAP